MKLAAAGRGLLRSLLSPAGLAAVGRSAASDAAFTAAPTTAFTGAATAAGPLRPAQPLLDLQRLGRTLVVAPHPDDEALGCGGLVALLRRSGQTVHAVLVSDGAQSHAHSRRYDAAARQALRAEEWQQGLGCLDVPADHLHTLGWPDGRVPGPGDERFADAVSQVHELLSRLLPQTLVLPWRRDPHPDHRAAHALFTQALRAGSPTTAGNGMGLGLGLGLGMRLTSATGGPLRCLEYAVWLHERAAPGDAPRAGEVHTWRLAVGSVLAAKQRAIACHRSQLGSVITDDPLGFVLPPALLARAQLPYELFYEGR